MGTELNNHKTTFIQKVLLFAVFVAPMGAQAFTIDLGFAQLSLLRISILIALLIGTIMLLFSKAHLLIGTSNNSYSAIFMLVWFGYAILSLLWSKDVNNWLKYIYFFFVGVISMVLFINHFKTREIIEKAFIALEIGITIQGIIGWYEIITRDYRFINAERLYEYGVRSLRRIPIAMSGNPNDFAMQMFIGVFLSLICYGLVKKRIAKLFFALILVNDAILLLMTTSRGVILALGIALAFMLFTGGRKKIAISFLVIIVILCNPNIINYISSVFDRTIGEVHSDNSRLGLILNGFNMLYQTFGFGVGCGQCSYWLENFAIYNVGGLRAMHNWWIEILASFGVGIFIAYLVFYIKMFRTMFIGYRFAKDKKNKNTYFCISAIMAGFVIGSISSSSCFTNEALWIFWSLCICLQGLSNLEEGPYID